MTQLIKPEYPVCSSCGSKDVKKDAWASWNVANQEWELCNTFDDTFCETCEMEQKINWMTEPEVTLIIGPDDYAACPVCGVRLDPDIDDETHDNRVVDQDESGPINLGICMEHGAFRFQIQKD